MNYGVKKNQYVLKQVELATGILLKRDGSRYLREGEVEDCFLFFESLETAKNFAQKRTEEKPNIECVIVDYQGETLIVQKGICYHWGEI